MPAIIIRDGLNAEIISANPHVTTGLGKYLRGQPAALLAGVDVAGQLRTPLHLANAGESGLGLSWASDVALGESGTALTIEVGAMAAIGVLNRTGMEVFATTFVGEPITVPANRALVSFSFRPSLALDAKKGVGALTFGFDAGAAADISCFHPFDLTGPTLSVGEACRTVLEHFVVPNDVDDLREMRDLPDGTIATVGGHGELRIAASVDVAAAFNPLASVDGIPVLGTLTVGGGASATVGVSATVSGDFQIRVEKTEGAVLRLSYHKVAGRELEVSLSATAGPAVSLGNRELLGMLFNGPGGIPGASKEDLVQGGITSKQLDRVAAAMRAGLSRKIELAIAASFSSSTTNEAAFLYEIDLDALDEDGAKALDSALAGNLGLINALEDTDGAHGVRVLRSVTRSIRSKRIAWRINLVGLVNVLSMSELVRSGTVAHDEESGELLIVDKITSDRVGAITTNNKIRKLLYESTLMSLTYRAIGLDAATSVLDISQSFFYFDKSANRQRVSDYLDAVRALDLIDSDGDNGLGAEDDFGKASLLLETSFDDAASARLFVSPQGVPDREFYERIGREALLALVKPGEPDDYRRLPLRDDRLWKKMRETGQPGFRFILPPPITGGGLEAIRVGVVESDYSLIVWWATAMAKAAERLAAMREFLARQPGRRAPGQDPLPPELDQNPEFLALRRELEKAMAKAIKNNKSTFDDPWGLIALHRASAGTATAAATLISPKLTLFLPEAQGDTGPSERDMTLRQAKMSAGSEVAFEASRAGDTALLTPGDFALLRRHVINLRMGALSSGGTFQTTQDDILALFTEHLPRFLEERRQQSTPMPLKLVFYAHGGLNDEMESLRNARNRIPFYLANRCYPVFFVWETGLRETLVDIVRQLAGFSQDRAAERRAAVDIVSGVSDPLLEQAFRPAGFSMWLNMKRSAELAFLPKQGGTFLVEQVAAFWKQHSAEVELHGIGHSAGTIFLAHMVNALCQQLSNPPITIRTLQYLAPAITIDLFKELVADLVGTRVGRFTEYTMQRDFEKGDAVGPYRKSLLYLVSRSFEDESEMGLLGLEESLRRDPEMTRFFGLLGPGQKRRGELLFSKREDGPSHSTIAIKHGDFDNDRFTMSGVIRRILDIKDDQPIVEFPESVSKTVLDEARTVAIASSPASARAAAAAAVPVLVTPTDLRDVMARLDALERRVFRAGV